MKPASKHIISLTISCAFLVSASALETERQPGVVNSASSSSSAITTSKDGKQSTIVITRDHDQPTVISVDVPELKATSTATTRLGVAADAIGEELSAHLPIKPGTGLIVRSVIPKSPAAASGLQENDVLVKLDDQLLIHPQQLRTLIRNKRAGDKVELAFLRKGERQTASATLDESTELPETEREGFFGFLGGKHFDGKKWEEYLKPLKDAAHRGKALFIGPDGKVGRIEEGKFEERILEQLAKSGVSEEVQKSVKKSLEQARDAVERARKAAELAAKAAEESARRSMEHALESAEKAKRQHDRDIRERENLEQDKTPEEPKN